MKVISAEKTKRGGYKVTMLLGEEDVDMLEDALSVGIWRYSISYFFKWRKVAVDFWWQLTKAFKQNKLWAWDKDKK